MSAVATRGHLLPAGIGTKIWPAFAIMSVERRCSRGRPLGTPAFFAAAAACFAHLVAQS
jgi:hypothetical protein